MPRVLREIGIGLAPLGRGFLTGPAKRAEDNPEGDCRRNDQRDQGAVIDANVRASAIVAQGDRVKRHGLARSLNARPQGAPLLRRPTRRAAFLESLGVRPPGRRSEPGTGLDFLGIPWILSSESSDFRGLCGATRQNVFLSPSRPRSAPEAEMRGSMIDENASLRSDRVMDQPYHAF